MFEGAPRELLKASKSLTGKHLAARFGSPRPPLLGWSQHCVPHSLVCAAVGAEEQVMRAPRPWWAG